MMKKYIAILIFVGLAIQLSCKKIIEIDAPKTSLIDEKVFQNDDLATSAILGIYRRMSETGFASGGLGSISVLGGLSSDELVGYSPSSREFNDNIILPTNSDLSSNLYYAPYQSIYTANAILEGLYSSTSKITPTVRDQLEGEALFVRAFSFFYLVNMFGPVPLNLSSNYKTNSMSSRATLTDVYTQIITDLKKAGTLLKDDYPGGERGRPNLAAVDALMSRTYLYLNDWQNAEKYSSQVIERNSTYQLLNFSDIFLKNSKEAIWQIMPSTSYGNTSESYLFILSGVPYNVSLSKDFVLDSFEPDDNRKDVWVRSFSDATGTYYYPYKYKSNVLTPVTEYSMVLRLSEQYLIRAEARIMQEKVSLGIADMNMVRQRTLVDGSHANLINPIPLSLNKLDALKALANERKVELFSEWGHRWFDLKRTGSADAILSPIKGKWKATAQLYPIPNSELLTNTNIVQNPGY